MRLMQNILLFSVSTQKLNRKLLALSNLLRTITEFTNLQAKIAWLLLRMVVITMAMILPNQLKEIPGPTTTDSPKVYP